MVTRDLSLDKEVTETYDFLRQSRHDFDKARIVY